MRSDRVSESGETAGRTDRLASVRSLVRARLGIDRRALAAFRIAVGLLVLADLLVLRVPGLVAFYTDDGVLPRSALAETYPAFAEASLHALSGAAWAQAALFALAGVLAVSLCVGYRTRLATAASALLLASLQARNPYALNGGDTILLTALILGVFLPLGARWSVDAGMRVREGRDRPRGGDDTRVVSAATAAILVHVTLIYATNAVLKFQSEPWMDGIAVQRVFHATQYLAGIGPYLAEFPALLAATGWLWTAVLTAAPLLVLATGRLRTGVAAAFAAAHLGMAATMRLGVFPFAMVACLLLFVPSREWDAVERAGRRAFAARAPGTARRAADAADAAVRALPGRIAPVAVPPAVRRGARVAVPVVVACLLLTSAVWQVGQIEGVDTPADEVDVGSASWSFFAPNPPDTAVGYLVEADLASGESVDLVRGGEARPDRPPDPAGAFPTTLWQRYALDLRYADANQYEPLAAYACERAPDGVERLTIHVVERPVGPDGPTGDPVARELVSRTCE